jgi:hypothetical protein
MMCITFDRRSCAAQLRSAQAMLSLQASRGGADVYAAPVTLLPACLLLPCCSGTVVRTGPGKYDKEAEGGRKAMVVQPGDKVRRLGGRGGGWGLLLAGLANLWALYCARLAETEV